MKVLLVDPYYLAGNSPPSWVLGQLESALRNAGHDVLLVDFCEPNRQFDTVAAFRSREAEFVKKVTRLGGLVDIVYITTSFGIPQKPTPIFARIHRILESVTAAGSGVPVVVGGAQVEYLTVHKTNPGQLLQYPNIVAFACSDEAFLRFLEGAATTSLKSESNGLWLRGDGSTFYLAAPNAGGSTTWPIPTAWKSWEPAKYPHYRAVLTSLGCRYGCTFCFESKQSFRPFGFYDTLRPYVDMGVRNFAIEDSTIFGAHGTKQLVQEVGELPGDINYTCYALVYEIAKADLADLQKLVAHGLRSVILGIETPDAETLRRYRKSVQADKVRVVLDKLHSVGISAQGCIMVGIPEVSLSDTLYTIDYALELDIDVRRWHVFQPEFDNFPEQIIVDKRPTIDTFADIDINLPDNLLPQLFASAGSETFLEEHFLMRSIPHTHEAPEELEQIRYSAGYSLRDLYQRILLTLKDTKMSFNEEDYFRYLDSSHPVYHKIIDRGSWLEHGGPSSKGKRDSSSGRVAG